MMQFKTLAGTMTLVHSEILLKNLTNKLSILNANIRGMRTNLDDFKVLLKNLNYTFPIIGVTETWFKTTQCGQTFFLKTTRMNLILYIRKLEVEYHSV